MKPVHAYKMLLASLTLLILLACNITYTAEFPTATSPALIQTATLPASTPPPDVLPTSANPSFVISTSTRNETGQNAEYTIDVQFPAILNSVDPIALAFNNEIQAHMQPQIDDFKRAVAETPKDPAFAASELTLKYTLIFQNATIVSIKFDFLAYISGAAHPYLIITTVNYDLAQSRQLALNELFLPNSNYLEVISNDCIAELKKLNAGFDEVSAAGAAPTPENYEDWNITPDGLMITFDQYQVAPGASGPQTVLVPYSELQAVIDPQGTLAGMSR